MRVVDLKRQFELKALFYGAAGSEKTRLSASAELDSRTAPALMISAIGNPLSIRDYPHIPKIIELERYQELTDIYNWLSRGQPRDTKMWKDLGRPSEKFKTIIVDGVTYLQRWAAAEASGNSDIGVGDVPIAMQQQHHGQVLARMTMLADKFFSLPMHVIFTTLEYEQQDSVGNLYYRVQLTGQSAGELPSYAYLVGRLIHRERISPRTVGAVASKTLIAAADKAAKNQQVDSLLLLQPSSRYYAKCQYCRPPRAIIKPTITKILDMIESRVPVESLEPPDEQEALEGEFAEIPGGTLGRG